MELLEKKMRGKLKELNSRIKAVEDKIRKTPSYKQYGTDRMAKLKFGRKTLEEVLKCTKTLEDMEAMV